MGWTVYNSDGKVLQSAELGDSSVTSAKIANGAILAADINASAAIAYTQLAALTDGNILVGNGSNVAVSVNPSGDVNVVNDGTFSITAGAIIDADVNTNAAIDATKIANGTVTSAEFQYINTLSSNAQTQITAKAAVGSATPSTQAFSDSAVSGSSAEAARVDHKHAMMATPSGVPSGVIAYMAGSCPSGWTEYTAARGRYVVGVPSGGTVAGTQGTALTNQENRAVGQHTHTFSGSALGTHNHTQSAHDHAFNVVQQQANNSTMSGDSLAAIDQFGAGNARTGGASVAMHSSTIGDTTGTNVAIAAGTPAGTNANAGSVANTNAPYIQLTVCQKD